MLDAALELFGTDGYRATSIERLCAAASVSTRNFYEEFSGREALLIAVHDRIVTDAFEASAATYEASGELSEPERFKVAARAYLESACADPRKARIAYVEVLGVSPAVEEHRIMWRDRFAEYTLKAAQKMVAEELAVDRDYSLTAIAICGAFNELAYEWAVRGRQVPLDAIVDEIIRMFGTSSAA
jgi:AcrR family transcriptional regulator